GHALFRGNSPDTADDVVVAHLKPPRKQASRTSTGLPTGEPPVTGCHLHVHEGLTPDTNYCFRVAPEQYNTVFIDYISGTICAYTREAESRPVWRIELAVRTANGTNDDTEDKLRVRLNSALPP